MAGVISYHVLLCYFSGSAVAFLGQGTRSKLNEFLVEFLVSRISGQIFGHWFSGRCTGTGVIYSDEQQEQFRCRDREVVDEFGVGLSMTRHGQSARRWSPVHFARGTHRRRRNGPDRPRSSHRRRRRYLRTFHQNLVKNMTSGTWSSPSQSLNPNKLFGEIESAAERLQQLTDGARCVSRGLYVHLCCLVEPRDQKPHRRTTQTSSASPMNTHSTSFSGHFRPLPRGGPRHGDRLRIRLHQFPDAPRRQATPNDGPAAQQDERTPRKQRKEANITRRASIAACKAAASPCSPSARSVLVFRKQMRTKSATRFPIRSNMQGPMCLTSFFRVR